METQAREKRFPCRQCGAKLVYQPGITALKCEYCGFENAIPQSDEDIEELDFHVYLARLADAEETVEAETFKCGACGAEMTRPEHATAFACPFCETDIVATGVSKRLIKPKSLLPFKVTREEGRASFRKWLASLWFAPNALRKYARRDEKLSGMYVPYWTYDAQTTTHYTGERGEHYYVTVGTGKNRRQVRRTRWYSVHGVVWNSFDDILVIASHSLPTRYAEKLEPWDLGNLVPYGDEYLSGFQAERYQVDLEQGFEIGRGVMEEMIQRSIKRDIGGDSQRIHSMRTQYDDVTFKHVLLPIWISAYRFRNEVYRFLVNGRTGEVQGERPYSWVKITLLVLVVAGAAGAAYWLF